MQDMQLLRNKVGEEEVAEVVSRWTGVPVSRLMEGEVQKLIRLEEHLHTCLSCNRALKQLRALIEGARQLPAEIEPARPLWPGIESRIAVTERDTQAAPARYWRWLRQTVMHLKWSVRTHR